jgi:carbonic anhydrase/acetyltransferase-like protein (isoleucine patch superfamily)
VLYGALAARVSGANKSAQSKCKRLNNQCNESAQVLACLQLLLILIWQPLGDPVAIYQLDACTPEVHDSVWIADNAQVMGSVAILADASIWFGVTVRGDTERIEIGQGSNIQDGSVLHADHGKPLKVGNHVTVGHMVMLHGCTIGDESLIGIGAVVLNGAKIGKNCLVGAGSLVTEGKEFADGSMIMGSPAKVVRALSPEQIDGLRQSARHYVENARRFKAGLRKID